MDVDKEYWNVPNSDDERDESLVNFKPISKADVPLQALVHYDQIDKQGFIELKVKEYRRLICKEKSECVEEQTSVTDDALEETTKEERLADCEQNRSPERSAFDYLEETDECQGQMPRRTPKSGRVNKKRVGTLKNVISNLKRFRELDHSTDVDKRTVGSADGESDLEKSRGVDADNEI